MQKIVAYADWDNTVPQGMSGFAHRLSLIDVIIQASMKFPTEDLVGTQHLVAGKLAAGVIQGLPQVLPAKPGAGPVNGLNVLGRLGRWRVFLDDAPEVEDKLFIVAAGGEKAVEITIAG